MRALMQGLKHSKRLLKLSGRLDLILSQMSVLSAARGENDAISLAMQDRGTVRRHRGVMAANWIWEKEQRTLVSRPVEKGECILWEF